MWTWLAGKPLEWRIPIKLAIFATVLLFVLFPNPFRLVLQVSHLSDTESLIQPGLAFIGEINREIDALLPAGASRSEELKAVERYVYQAIPYAFDWDLWGNLDYWPSAQEVWDRRREDCDGRAVLSASILRARGFKDARLVGNISHVWVVAGGKELMGAEEDRNFRRENGRIVVTPPKLKTVLRGLSQIQHFPFWRIVVLVMAGGLLVLHPCRGLVPASMVVGMSTTSVSMLYAWAARYDDGGGGQGWLWGSLVVLGVTWVGAMLTTGVVGHRPRFKNSG